MSENNCFLMIGIGMLVFSMLWNRVSIFLIRERVSALEKIVDIERSKPNSGYNNPLPLKGDETTNSPERSSSPVTIVVSPDDEHTSTGRVVVGDIGSAEPSGYGTSDAGAKAHQETPRAG